MSIKRIFIGLFAVAGLLAASPAFAGVGVAVAPDFPATILVGQTGVAVGLEITNNSTSDVGPITLSNIRLIPQCGNTDADSTTCTIGEANPGVFTVGATGVGAAACLGTSFTIGENDAITGQVLLTPSAPIVLTDGATCRINFTVDVNSVPLNDAGVQVGVQTLQIGKVNADTSILSGTGLGTDITTVSKVTPTISTILSTTSAMVGTAVNDTATLTGATATVSGTVAYTSFTDTSCDVGAQSAGVKSVTNGIVPNSNPITYNATGTYYWQAIYSGDFNNNAATSTCTEEIVTITQPLGRIVVDKVTNPAADPQSFAFTSNGAGYSNFALTDIASPNGQDLLPGTYSVSEGAVAGWVQTDASCVSSLGGSENPASIGLTEGETVTCTFTNTKNGRLIVDKMTTPAGSLTVFPIVASGNGVITGGGTSTVTDVLNAEYEVAPGTYSVSETLPANWTQTSNTCNGVTVAAGATVTCLISNAEQVAAQYCSPGYWKQTQHFDSYPSPYTGSTLFSSVFANAFPGKTLVGVLSNGGGGLAAFGRATVGGLLNAGALDAGTTTAGVIATFNSVYANAPTGSKANGYYGSASSLFTAAENCPLN